MPLLVLPFVSSRMLREFLGVLASVKEDWGRRWLGASVWCCCISPSAGRLQCKLCCSWHTEIIGYLRLPVTLDYGVMPPSALDYGVMSPSALCRFLPAVRGAAVQLRFAG